MQLELHKLQNLKNEKRHQCSRKENKNPTMLFVKTTRGNYEKNFLISKTMQEINLFKLELLIFVLQKSLNSKFKSLNKKTG